MTQLEQPDKVQMGQRKKAQTRLRRGAGLPWPLTIGLLEAEARRRGFPDAGPGRLPRLQNKIRLRLRLLWFGRTGDKGKRRRLALYASPPSVDAPLVVWFHGVAQQLAGSTAAIAERLVALGYGVLAIEYPGFGLLANEGPPSERHIYADADATLCAVLSSLGRHPGACGSGSKLRKQAVPKQTTLAHATQAVPNQTSLAQTTLSRETQSPTVADVSWRGPVVLVGYSLGTGVAAELAARGLGDQLVLLAPYTSVPAMDMGCIPRCCFPKGGNPCSLPYGREQHLARHSLYDL